MLLALVLLALAASVRASPDVNSLFARLDALERGLEAANARSDKLEIALHISNERVAELESTLASYIKYSSFDNLESNITCNCNHFFTDNVTISSPWPDRDVYLTVGTATTGFVNGINLQQLENTAIYNNGPQTIDGTLTVSAINIGLWSLTVDGSGNLNIEPTIGNGEVVVQSSLSASANLQVGGAGTFAEAIVVSGTSTFTDVNVNTALNVGGGLSAATVTATSGYNLCNSANQCINQYPVFEVIHIGTCPSGVISCPSGWVSTFSVTHCDGNFFPAVFSPGAQSAPCYCAGEAWIGCMFAGVA